MEQKKKNIVERLRKGTCLGMFPDHTVNYSEVAGAMSEAADEIERLEELIAHMSLDEEKLFKEIGRLRTKLDSTTICPACKAEFLPGLGREREDS